MTHVHQKQTWKSVPLGTLAEFRNGVNFTKANFGRGIKVINVKDFQDRFKPSYEELGEINPKGVVRENDLLKEDDIVFVRSNGNRQLIGRSLLIKGASEPVTHSAFTIRARFQSPEAFPLFCAYALRSYIVRDALSAFGGGTNINNLNQGILSSLLVPLPPLSTQERIAEVLSAYDELIENNARRIKILEEMAQSLYREWFVHFRFPGHEKVKFVDSPVGKIPEGWEVVKFTDLAEVLSGGTPKTTVAEYWGGPIPFFGPTDAPLSFYVISTQKHITQLGLSKCNSSLYPKDTVFITARGTVGSTVIASGDMAMNQSCYALSGREEVSQLYLFLLTLNSIEYLKKNTGGATFQTIVIDTFRRFDVVRPPSPIIDRFTEQARPLFDGILNLLRRSSNLRQTLDLLLPKLVSGEAVL